MSKTYFGEWKGIDERLKASLNGERMEMGKGYSNRYHKLWNLNFLHQAIVKQLSMYDKINDGFDILIDINTRTNISFHVKYGVGAQNQNMALVENL